MHFIDTSDPINTKGMSHLQVINAYADRVMDPAHTFEDRNSFVTANFT